MKRKAVHETTKKYAPRKYGEKQPWNALQIRQVIMNDPEDIKFLIYITDRKIDSIRFKINQIIHLVGLKMKINIGLSQLDLATKKAFKELYSRNKLHPSYHKLAAKIIAKKITTEEVYEP